MKKLAIILGLGLTAAFGCRGQDVVMDHPQNPPAVRSIDDVVGYDNHTASVTDEDIDGMLNSAYQIRVVAKYISETTGMEQYLQFSGTCFIGDIVEEDNYFVTCNHVVDLPETLTPPSVPEVLSLIEGQSEIKIKETWYKAEVAASNEDKDVAIVSVKGDFGLKKSYDFADKQLQPGDVVYAVGYPLGIGRFLSQGIITNVESNDLFFYESAALNPGNSGGPLYVLERGKPKIAGVGSFLIRGTQGIFGAVRYDNATSLLDQVRGD